MKLFFQYIRIETKRMFLALPKILFVSFFLLALLSGIFLFCLQHSIKTEQDHIIKIGVVAQEDEPFVDWMISAVSNMKNIEFNCQFKRISKQDASRKLQSGEFAVAFFIPENYVASIVNGENKHLIIRMGNGQTTIVHFLLKQLSEAASSFILNSEAGIYTMQEYYDLQNLPSKTEDELKLNLQYIKDIAELEKGIKTETVASVNSYPLQSRYIISGFVLFLLFWGLAGSKLLVPPKKTFQNQLAINGVSQYKQVLARYLSFLTASFSNYLVLFLVISAILTLTGFSMPDTIIKNVSGLWRFAACCLPLLVFASAVIQLIYEITGDAISGILFLFFGIMLLALCSGCFYPLEYLPDSLQELAPKLPIYQACQYGLSILHQTYDGAALLRLIIYFTLCLILMASCRVLRYIAGK